MIKQDILEKRVKFSYLGIGSNLGNKIENIEHTKKLLNYYNISVLESSSLYETPSWPNKEFPNYYNAVFKIKTNYL